LLTKKDYHLIANIINYSWLKERQTYDSVSLIHIIDDAYHSLVDRFCNNLEEDNPRFDETKFRQACCSSIEI